MMNSQILIESKHNPISAHKKIKHLTKKYRRFRYLKDKRKRIDLDQFFDRLKSKEKKELNFSNFFSKLNEFNKLDGRNEQSNLDEINSPSSSPIASNEFKSVHNDYNQLITNEDSENHLLELIKASSTITNRKVIRNQLENHLFSSTKKETKKSSAAKHRERTIDLLNEFNSYENNLIDKEDRIVNEEILTDYYLNRIKECLNKDEQLTLIGLLEEFDLIYRKLTDRKQEIIGTNKCSTNEELDLNEELKQIYFKIEELVNDCSTNSELIDEFLLFMNYEIVKQLDKQFDFNYWIKIKNFVQKIAIYLNQNCDSLMRLIKLLKQLKQNETDLDKKRIRTVLNKFLNSQPYLLNELNSLFLEESPQDYLFAFSEDFDEIDLDEEINCSTPKLTKNDHPKFECIDLIDLTEEEKVYLTNDCPCKKCHHNQQSDRSPLDNQFLKHCISCSLRYFKNKFYCEENQKLHFTSIEYIEKQEEDELN